MSYEAIFEAGSLNGKRWRIPEGGTLVIGRSHSCGIRPEEPDVSGRHMVVGVTDGKAWIESLSTHRTEIDGARLATGERRVVSGEPLVRLGGHLVFRIREVADEDDATGDIAPASTSTLSGATRTIGGGTAMVGTGTTHGVKDAETSFFATDSRTGIGESAGTQATRAAGTETFPTAATRAMADETGILTGGDQYDNETGTLTGGGQNDDETQMLHTQMASREELEKLKAIYEQKQKSRVARRFFLFGAIALAALGASIYVSTRKPENPLSQPKAYDSRRIIPDLVPTALAGAVAGEVGLAYPLVGASIKKTDNSIEVRTLIGRKLDVEVVVAADVFEDDAALGESRNATFMRYIAKSPELVKILDNMYPLPDEDFFGGMGGQVRGIPCSRVEYWRMRGRDNVYGVVSFFRSGTLCCALRREVSAAEKERAAWLLTDTRTWLYADAKGAFAASQWEGAEGAGCADPALEISRCESRFAVDSPAEWPEIERGLRDILAETWGDDGYADVRSRALKLLADLRARKATNWKRLVASRVPISLPDGGTSDKLRAAELDEAVRKDYPSPDEEWHFLARRKKWWE